MICLEDERSIIQKVFEKSHAIKDAEAEAFWQTSSVVAQWVLCWRSGPCGLSRWWPWRGIFRFHSRMHLFEGLGSPYPRGNKALGSSRWPTCGWDSIVCVRGRFGFGFLNYRGAPRAGFSARFWVFSGKVDVSMRGKWNWIRRFHRLSKIILESHHKMKFQYAWYFD